MLARRSAALLVAALAVLPAGTAQAGVRQPGVVSQKPVANTPHVLDGIVNAIALVGGTVVVGGEFSAVSDAGSDEQLPRENLFAYDLRTGKVLAGFAPSFSGPVYALASGADGTVYVGGSFDFPARALVRLSLTDGSAVTSFDAPAFGGDVASLVRQGDKIYVGGDFIQIGSTPRTALARIDASTGAVDPAFTITPGAPRGASTKVYAMAATGDRLVIDGSFTSVDGLRRPQVAVIDLVRNRVADWRTEVYAPSCMAVFPWYVRGLDVSPDGRYFVVVTTGGPAPGTRKLCDSAARFEMYSRGDDIRPTWVNLTGGDSLYSVAVTGAAVYVGGHLRWLNNPKGSDTAGPGAVQRTGIGAIHPTTGKALSWNPTRTRGIGVKAFLTTKSGLLVGSDTTKLGHEYHARIGMFPLP
ncbi:delta-60 repeat domain-containing protein [Microtetraspora sp. AC03309]|uniref:delta-60 repeat domain-containing protein n=1 Tax=Microtetraspora sp. AC03309 TaxID=2779376 RepID=UPI001E58D78E|nr:delta-60 repeat domain-containing protein [Microtetraspora sp. AC03309]MCC5576663.1 delta-60 repeat domain-containing protein [Microtetraspora sp. AC03309]